MERTSASGAAVGIEASEAKLVGQVTSREPM
jgi:hypothetical protein